MKNLTLSAAAVALGLLANAASAATCSIGGVTYTATQGTPDAILGSTCLPGNDTNTITASYTIFGADGWILGDKTDGPDGTGELIFGTPTPASNQTLWSLLNPNGYSEIFITFKQANSFAAFLLDGSKALAGFWGTSGPGRSVNDLSHASVYYRGEPMAPVPLPAGGALLIGALGMLGFVRRRKAK